MTRRTGRLAGVTELAVLQGTETLPCPPGNTVEFQAEWARIVEDFPDNWFRLSDIPIITEYIRTKLLLDRYNKQISDPDFNFVYTDPKGVPKAHPMMLLQAKAQINFKMLAMAVKTSPQSREFQVPKKVGRPRKTEEVTTDPLAGCI